MKRITVLSVMAAALLFSGCNDESKKAASEATTKVTESTKEVVKSTEEAVEKAGEAITEATDKAVAATKEAAEATKEAATEAVETTKKGVTEAADSAKAAVGQTVSNDAGAALFKKCSGCHGVDGKTKALGKSAEIAGESKDDLVAKIKEYKAGTRNVAGMGSLMKGQVASLSDADIDAVSGYISTLK